MSHMSRRPTSRPPSRSTPSASQAQQQLTARSSSASTALAIRSRQQLLPPSAPVSGALSATLAANSVSLAPRNNHYADAVKRSAFGPPPEPGALAGDIARFLNLHAGMQGKPVPNDLHVYRDPDRVQQDDEFSRIGSRPLGKAKAIDYEPQQRTGTSGASGFSSQQRPAAGDKVLARRPAPLTLANLPFTAAAGAAGSSSNVGSQGSSQLSSRESYQTAQSNVSFGTKLERSRPVNQLMSLRTTRSQEMLGGLGLNGPDLSDPRNLLSSKALPGSQDHPRAWYAGSLSISNPSSRSSSAPAGGGHISAGSSIRDDSPTRAAGNPSTKIGARPSRPQQTRRSDPSVPKQQAPRSPQEVQPLQHFRGRGGSTAAATLRQRPPASTADQTLPPSPKTSGGRAKLQKRRR